VGKLGDAVGQGHETECQELVESDRFLVMGAQMDHQSADHHAEQSADAKSAH